MELAKKPAIALFFGFIIGLLLWVYFLIYIEDKPVPNAVFTQSEHADTSTKVDQEYAGVDSKLFSEITKQPALNFGCAAGMGELYFIFTKEVYGWQYGHFRFWNITYQWAAKRI